MLLRTRKNEVVCEAAAGEAEVGVTGRGQLDEKESDGECKVLPLGPFTVFTLSLPLGSLSAACARGVREALQLTLSMSWCQDSVRGQTWHVLRCFAFGGGTSRQQ